MDYGPPFKVNSHHAGAYAYFEDKDSRSFYKGVYKKQSFYDRLSSQKFSSYGWSRLQAIGGREQVHAEL
ncbi:MAG TPA: hypothetical protein VMF56_16670 [Acidobacteriaceae bacterium]|nr:hypothetical protein [Acidobacteriaceae bacterium]